MSLNIQNPDDIYNWDLAQLWNALQTIEEEELLDYKKDIELIKNGIEQKIPIIYIIKHWNTEYPENKRVSIKGHWKIDIVDYYDEIMNREKLARKIIFENLSDDDPTTPRT